MYPRKPGVAPRAACVAALCLSVVAAAMPVAATEITLTEAVRRAVERAPLLDARRAQVDAAQSDVQRADALPDPMLMVGFDNLPVTGANAFDTRVDDMTMKKIGVRQQFPARAKREAQRSLAMRRSEQAGADVLDDRSRVEQATAEAWVELWAAQREQSSLAALRAQAALASRLAKARVAGGSDSVTDALAAEAAVIELDNRIEATQARARSASAELARWIGEDVERVTDAAPDFTTLPMPEAELLAEVDRSTSLLSASARVETAAAAIDVARAERRSDWGVAASYGQRAGGRSDMLMLELSVGLPMFTRSRQAHGIAASEADYRAALAMREDLRRQQTARIRAGIARWQGVMRQIALHEDALLPLARDRSAAALAAYRAGGPLRAWLDARRDELEAYRAHADHLAELGRAWAALAYLLPAQEEQP